MTDAGIGRGADVSGRATSPPHFRQNRCAFPRMRSEHGWQSLGFRVRYSRSKFWSHVRQRPTKVLTPPPGNKTGTLEIPNLAKRQWRSVLKDTYGFLPPGCPVPALAWAVVRWLSKET